MNWYLQEGKDSDVVVSSRIRIARNISGYSFIEKANDNELIEIKNVVKNVMPNIGYGLKYLDLENIDDLTKMSLVEKRLVSPNFVMNNENKKAILVNDEENISIMINEEDHLRLQVFGAGLELQNLMNLLDEIDTKISQNISYAYNKKYGFLTACPTNVGTGIRASVMVHLPALTKTQNISKILDAISNFGMEIRGIYGEGSKTIGNMYQISNKQTLNITEREIINNLCLITQKIIEQERLARKIISKNEMELEDMVYRAYGILTNCKKISSEETLELVSKVKLGIDMGIIKEIDELKLNKIILFTKPASLQKYVVKNLDSNKRDIERANVIKSIVNEN